MASHVVINIDPPIYVLPPPPPLLRQNALSPEQWRKLMTPPSPAKAFLSEKWDIEKGRY